MIRSYRIGKCDQHKCVTRPDVEVVWVQRKLWAAVLSNEWRHCKLTISCVNVLLLVVQSNLPIYS